LPFTHRPTQIKPGLKHAPYQLRLQPMQRYRAFVTQGIDDDMKRFYGKGNISTVLGNPSFKKNIIKQSSQYQSHKADFTTTLDCKSDYYYCSESI